MEKTCSLLLLSLSSLSLSLSLSVCVSVSLSRARALSLSQIPAWTHKALVNVILDTALGSFKRHIQRTVSSDTRTRI